MKTYDVFTFVELCNPFMSDPTLMDGKGDARLFAYPTTSTLTNGYPVYKLLITQKNTMLHAPENTSGMPDWKASYANVTVPPVPGVDTPVAGQVLGTVTSEWNTLNSANATTSAIDGSVVSPLNGGFAAPNNQGGNAAVKGPAIGFCMVGPPPDTGLKSNEF